MGFQSVCFVSCAFSWAFFLLFICLVQFWCIGLCFLSYFTLFLKVCKGIKVSEPLRYLFICLLRQCSQCLSHRFTQGIHQQWVDKATLFHIYLFYFIYKRINSVCIHTHSVKSSFRGSLRRLHPWLVLEYKYWILSFKKRYPERCPIEQEC